MKAGTVRKPNINEGIVIDNTDVRPARSNKSAVNRLDISDNFGVFIIRSFFKDLYHPYDNRHL
jgi:hypothetical protein